MKLEARLRFPAREPGRAARGGSAGDRCVAQRVAYTVAYDAVQPVLEWIDDCWARFEARSEPYVVSDAIRAIDLADPVELWEALVARDVLSTDWIDGGTRRYAATEKKRGDSSKVERTNIDEHHSVRSSDAPRDLVLARWLGSDPPRALECEQLAIQAARTFELALTRRALGPTHVLWTRDKPLHFGPRSARTNRLFAIAGPLLGDPERRAVGLDAEILAAVRSRKNVALRRAIYARTDALLARAQDVALPSLLRSAAEWRLFCDAIEPFVPADEPLCWTVEYVTVRMAPKSMSLTRAQLVDPLRWIVELYLRRCMLIEWGDEWVYLGALL